MVRKSKEEKAKTREQILTSAAALFRAQGIEATSVADVMKDSGLTHGGFYKHFPNKDALVAEAIGQAFNEMLAALQPSSAEADGVSISHFAASQYLTEIHIDKPEHGCPMPALGAEVGRGHEIWQQAFSEGAEDMIVVLSDGERGEEKRRAAAGALATMVGTILLSRASGKGKLRSLFLEAGRESALRQLLGEARQAPPVE